MTINANGNLVGGSICLSKAGVTGLSGAATTFSTGATAVTYANQGKLPALKAQVSGGVTPTVDVVTGAAFKPIQKNQGGVFVFTLDAAGNYGVAQGPLPVSPTTTGTQTNVDDSGNYSFMPQFPSIPDALTAVSYVVVRAQSTYAGSGFIFGTALWNTTGIVISTPQDIMTLPAVPQVA